MRKIAVYAAFGVALLGITACQSTGSNEPPAGATLYQVPVSKPGTEMVFRTTSANNDSTRTSRVLEITTYNGVQANRVSRGGDFYYFDVKTDNWMARVDKDGTPIRSATPHSGTYAWPMWVGKSWRAKYDYTDHTKGRTWNGTSPSWKVEALETITVPAGTFETLRLQSGPGKGVGIRQTWWYAPKIGIAVKTIFERTNRHYLGSGGKRETVLVSFTPPS